MTKEELRQYYGDEYPAAVFHQGTRIPLKRETRFSRIYKSSDTDVGTLILSRFMDGSASMTLADLQREWSQWSNEQRLDFCNECSWLHKQSDFADMLRFIVPRSTADEFAAIASKIAAYFPQAEGFPILLRALEKARIGKTSNILQAMAFTKHADALPTLRAHLDKIWKHPSLQLDDAFLNWPAFDAINCIQYLIQLGASPDEFADEVRELSVHACRGNRESCRRWLACYYPWLQ